MPTSEFIIREIKPSDNKEIEEIVKSVILEMGAPKIGTAYEDVALKDMYSTYQKNKAIYFVIVNNGRVLGGGGIAKLNNFEGNICELQKMYFSPSARGKGLGSKLISKCLQKAIEFGFESCYLETLPYMKAAQKLYLKNGFTHIDGPMGNTSHYSCDVWMIKEL